MSRNLVLLSALAILFSSAVRGQTPPPASQPAPPSTQPAAPLSPADILVGVEQRLTKGREARRLGRDKEANALFADAQNGLELVLRNDPRNTEARVLAGELATETRNYEDARDQFLAAYNIEKENFRANLGLGRYYVDSRNWRQAGKYLETAARVAPADRQGETLRLLAVTYNGQGRRDKALETVQRAVKANPVDADTLQLLVQVRGEMEQYEQAVETAKQLVAVQTQAHDAQPAEPTVLQQLIQAYDTLGKALSLYHNHLYRKDARGNITDQVLPGKEAEAAAVLSQVAEIGEHSAKLQTELKHFGTLMLMDRAVTYQPANTQYLLDMATLLEATHQPDRAIETYQRLLQVTAPSDTDKNQAQHNQNAAREALERLHAPLTSQPAASAPVP
jgi:tetratricopeptide (TPR) repeat protein